MKEKHGNIHYTSTLVQTKGIKLEQGSLNFEYISVIIT